MKAYITKYALTEGILERNGEVSRLIPTIFTAGRAMFHGEGREWHRTREDAVTRAEVMRKAKIKSVKKQLARLQAMTF